MLKKRLIEGMITVKEGLHLHDAEVKFDGKSWDGQRYEEFISCSVDFVMAKLLRDQRWKSGGRFRLIIEPDEQN